MAQTPPKYPHMTSLSNDFISDFLVNKFGFNNVVWTIVWMHAGELSAYLYERNGLSSINHPDDMRPISLTDLKNVFIDFTEEFPNSMVREAPPMLSGKYSNSYEYVLESKTDSTVDLDYVWYDGQHWKGIELTTWYIAFDNEATALRLIKTINRRPSWKGVNRAHGTKKIVYAAQDLSVTFFMLCVNSKKGVSNDIIEDGNALLFPLDIENIELLLNGKEPQNYKFGKLNELLSLI